MNLSCQNAFALQFVIDIDMFDEASVHHCLEFLLWMGFGRRGFNFWSSKCESDFNLKLLGGTGLFAAEQCPYDCGFVDWLQRLLCCNFSVLGRLPVAASMRSLRSLQLGAVSTVEVICRRTLAPHHSLLHCCI